MGIYIYKKPPSIKVNHYFCNNLLYDKTFIVNKETFKTNQILSYYNITNYGYINSNSLYLDTNHYINIKLYIDFNIYINIKIINISLITIIDITQYTNMNPYINFGMYINPNIYIKLMRV